MVAACARRCVSRTRRRQPDAPKRHDLVQAVAERFVDGMLHDAGEAAAAGDVGAMLQRIAAAVADQGHMRMFTGVIVEADGDPGLRSILVRLTLRLQSTLAERLGGEHAMERAGHVLASLWGLGLYDFMVRPGRGSTFTASFLAALAKSRGHAAPAGKARRRPR